MTRSVEIPEEAVELAWQTITRLLASRNANPSSVYRSDVRAALEAAVPPDTRPEEERGFVEVALRAVDAGNAGHWPTVAGYLADEVRRLRAALPYLAPAGDGGLREALEKLADELDSNNVVMVAGRALRDLLTAHPAAPAVPQPAGNEIERTLSELADLWHVPADVLAVSRDLAAAIFAAYPAPSGAGFIADGERVAAQVRETLSFETGAAGEPLLTQQANRITHGLLTAGVFREAAVPQSVDREALAKALRACICNSLPRPTCPLHGDEYARADAVLAVLAGEQEQVER